MYNTPLSLNGIPVIIAEPIKCTNKVKRTWRERLFTLPFRPFSKFRAEYFLKGVLKDGEIIKLSTGLHMTQKTFNECEKAIIMQGVNK